LDRDRSRNMKCRLRGTRRGSEAPPIQLPKQAATSLKGLGLQQYYGLSANSPRSIAGQFIGHRCHNCALAYLSRLREREKKSHLLRQPPLLDRIDLRRDIAAVDAGLRE